MKKITINRLTGWALLICALIFPPSGFASQTGGKATGITKIMQVVCKNKTTRQRVVIRKPVGTLWSCEQAGLMVSAGDKISQSIEGYAQGNIPDAPVVSAMAGDGSVSLSWEMVGDTESYNVYMDVNPAFEPDGSNLLRNTFQTAFSQTGLNNGVRYYFYVSAVNAYGESALSAQVSAMPGMAIPFDHATVAGQACASAGCHDGTNATPKPPTHPLTTDVCEACHTPWAWLPVIVPFDHSNAIDSSCAGVGCHSMAEMPPNHVPTVEDCGICHFTDTWLPIFTPAPPAAPFDHNTVAGLACASAGCHDGSSTSTSKSPNHVLTSDICEACHTPNSWLPLITPFDHSQAMASCSTCHNGTTATGKSAIHIATKEECDVCHTTTVGWTIPAP